MLLPVVFGASGKAIVSYILEYKPYQTKTEIITCENLKALKISMPYMSSSMGPCTPEVNVIGNEAHVVFNVELSRKFEFKNHKCCLENDRICTVVELNKDIKRVLFGKCNKIIWEKDSSPEMVVLETGKIYELSGYITGYDHETGMELFCPHKRVFAGIDGKRIEVEYMKLKGDFKSAFLGRLEDTNVIIKAKVIEMINAELIEMECVDKIVDTKKIVP